MDDLMHAMLPALLTTLLVTRELSLPCQPSRVPVHLLHHVLDLQLLQIEVHLLAVLYTAR